MDASSYFQYAIIVLCGFLCAFYVNRRIASYPYKQVHDMFTNNPISNHYGSNQDIIAVVTGSTSGLGEGIASELFKYGFTVIIASRNYEKSMRVIDDIRCKYPGSAGRLIFSKLDTSDLQSVGQFSSWFSETFDHLDYLVNNAGIQYGSIENNPLFNTSAAIDSSQGYDLVFATNYMGHFLLTHLMFHHLRYYDAIHLPMCLTYPSCNSKRQYIPFTVYMVGSLISPVPSTSKVPGWHYELRQVLCAPWMLFQFMPCSIITDLPPCHAHHHIMTLPCRR